MSQWSVAFNEKCLQNIKNTLNKIKDDEIRIPITGEKKCLKLESRAPYGKHVV